MKLKELSTSPKATENGKLKTWGSIDVENDSLLFDLGQYP